MYTIYLNTQLKAATVDLNFCFVLQRVDGVDVDVRGHFQDYLLCDGRCTSTVLALWQLADLNRHSHPRTSLLVPQ